MNHGQEHEVVAVWAEHSASGHHYEELRADGTVDAWTQPPYGETRYPGEEDPDHNPICSCPGQWPRPLPGVRRLRRRRATSALASLLAAG
jgi:hypothetical protein